MVEKWFRGKEKQKKEKKRLFVRCVGSVVVNAGCPLYFF